MHSERLARPLWPAIAFWLCLNLARAAETCYWRSQNTVTVQTGGWFACNNTNTTPGGAQLCCLNGANCGNDALCATSDSGGGSGWFVGGCTDPTYQDPVCRKSCTGDAQTWIQYNFTSELWHCCGSDGCTGTPTSETFQALPPSEWSAVPSSPTANPSSSTLSTTGTVTVTASATGGASNSGLSTGATAAIGVLAALLGLALIAAAAFFVLWRKRKQQQNRDISHDAIRQQEQAQPQMGYQSPPVLYQPISHQAELDAARQNSERPELDGYQTKPR